MEIKDCCNNKIPVSSCQHMYLDTLVIEGRYLSIYIHAIICIHACVNISISIYLYVYIYIWFKYIALICSVFGVLQITWFTHVHPGFVLQGMAVSYILGCWRCRRRGHATECCWCSSTLAKEGVWNHSNHFVVGSSRATHFVGALNC